MKSQKLIIGMFVASVLVVSSPSFAAGNKLIETAQEKAISSMNNLLPYAAPVAAGVAMAVCPLSLAVPAVIAGLGYFYVCEEGKLAAISGKKESIHPERVLESMAITTAGNLDKVMLAVVAFGMTKKIGHQAADVRNFKQQLAAAKDPAKNGMNALRAQLDGAQADLVTAQDPAQNGMDALRADLVAARDPVQNGVNDLRAQLRDARTDLVAATRHATMAETAKTTMQALLNQVVQVRDPQQVLAKIGQFLGAAAVDAAVPQ